MAEAPAASGVHLDPNDPDDARIIARQVKAARQAGRDGRDRGRSTRGRADLEAAYDEGANEGSDEGANEGSDEEDDEGGEPDGSPGRGARARAAASRGAKKSAAGLSRGRWRPTLTPPTRARDAGGLLVGMALYTVAITYIRYGPAGWTGWLRAKFLNQPMQGLPPSSIGSTTGARPSGNGLV
jgi:hypothetical protein